MNYKNMRKSLIVFSLGSGLLMTAAGAQAPSAAHQQKGAKTEKAEKKAEKAEEKSSTPAQTPSNACYLWRGRGGAPPGYMATHASCRPWGSNQGWVFLKNNNGVSYYQGTLKDAVVTPTTPHTWAVYTDFSSAVFSSKADYDWFVANTKLYGSCAECLR